MYQGKVRGMAIAPTLQFPEFVEKIANKFRRSPQGVHLEFECDDGEKIAMEDEGDYDMAIETARALGEGTPNWKLSVWVLDP